MNFFKWLLGESKTVDFREFAQVETEVNEIMEEDMQNQKERLDEICKRVDDEPVIMMADLRLAHEEWYRKAKDEHLKC